MAAKAGFTERSEKIAQSFVPKEIQTLIGDFKSRLLLCLADLASDAGSLGRIVRLVNADVIFLLHALDEFVDQIVERTFGLHLLKLLAQLVIQHLTFEQGAFDGALEIV